MASNNKEENVVSQKEPQTSFSDTKSKDFKDTRKNFVEKTLRQKMVPVIPVPSVFKIPEKIISQIKESRIRDQNFDPSQIIKLADAPLFLTMELNTELGFTTAKLLKIAQNLDPRIILEVEGEIFVDKELLKKGFATYLKKVRDKNILRMSRNSRAGLRRNLILRESLECFEEILKESPELQEKLTESINTTLGDSFKRMAKNDILAFLESYRINAEKRRIRAEEEEQELLALEELDI